ncbi:hypothetical protein [Pseudoflavonifractor sp. MSJ-37]|uniref:hypothetical protein n=1 Tax=Pseudoflavonifractor sp. MSJ-37 TaxID=2841531 RepID=UPI001C0F690A|nr:hypothetical protein [Pseudoflavonifractor sp. MSJ-37]MBU5434609.1 hypothetical protein [Pseudoflavonifractor sp. MSJ-37]
MDEIFDLIAAQIWNEREDLVAYGEVDSSRFRVLLDVYGWLEQAFLKKGMTLIKSYLTDSSLSMSAMTSKAELDGARLEAFRRALSEASDCSLTPLTNGLVEVTASVKGVVTIPGTQ